MPSDGAPHERVSAWLKGPDDALRVKAMDRLGETRPDGALEILVPWLTHPNRDVRLSAVFNLGEIRDPRAIEPLLDIARNDPDKDMRDEAIRAMDAWRDNRILQGLLREVERPDRSRVVLRSVAQQLRHYDRPEAIDALFHLLGDDELHVQDAAAESLLELNRPSFRPAWKRALGVESELVRLAARRALDELEGSDPTPDSRAGPSF